MFNLQSIKGYRIPKIRLFSSNKRVNFHKSYEYIKFPIMKNHQTQINIVQSDEKSFLLKRSLNNDKDFNFKSFRSNEKIKTQRDMQSTQASKIKMKFSDIRKTIDTLRYTEKAKSQKISFLLEQKLSQKSKDSENTVKIFFSECNSPKKVENQSNFHFCTEKQISNRGFSYTKKNKGNLPSFLKKKITQKRLQTSIKNSRLNNIIDQNNIPQFIKNKSGQKIQSQSLNKYNINIISHNQILVKEDQLQIKKLNQQLVPKKQNKKPLNYFFKPAQSQIQSSQMKIQFSFIEKNSQNTQNLKRLEFMSHKLTKTRQFKDQNQQKQNFSKLIAIGLDSILLYQ